MLPVPVEYPRENINLNTCIEHLHLYASEELYLVGHGSLNSVQSFLTSLTILPITVS